MIDDPWESTCLSPCVDLGAKIDSLTAFAPEKCSNWHSGPNVCQKCQTGYKWVICARGNLWVTPRCELGLPNAPGQIRVWLSAFNFRVYSNWKYHRWQGSDGLRLSWPFTSRFEFREFELLCDYCASFLILQHFVKSEVRLRDTALANAHDDRLLLRIHGTKKDMDRGGWRPR